MLVVAFNDLTATPTPSTATVTTSPR